MTKTPTESRINHLPFALMKDNQLIYEDMVCDNSLKKGVDKGLASLTSKADRELVVQKMKKCW